jgi:hypothetical protein
MRAVWVLSFLALACSSAHGALPDRIACVATDTFWVWYGEGIQAAPKGLNPLPGQYVLGSRLIEPQEQFRIQNGSLFFLDGSNKEYLYGPIAEFDIGRYRSGDWTIMFDPEPISATAVRVDQHHTRVYRYRCVVG